MYKRQTSTNVSVASSVTATTYYGSGANLTGLSGISVASQADNRIITCTGTSDALTGESSLTFDGTTIAHTGTSFKIDGTDTNASNSNCFIQFNAGKINLHADENNVVGGTASGVGFNADGTYVGKIQATGFMPGTDNNFDLGSSSSRWANVYANNLYGNGSNLTGISAGISMMDMWRITNDNNISGDADIDSYWERNDTFFAQIGSGMSESSGVFTFPQTGIYLIMVQAATYGNGHSYAGFFTQVSTDSGGSYSNFTYCYGNHRGGSGYNNLFVNGILDVTDESTFRMKMRGHTPGNLQFSGDTNAHRTGITFIRIGDT